MRQLSSADFRKQYAALTEPVQVTTHDKPLGKWYPDGAEPQLANPPLEAVDFVPTPDERMTIRPVKVNKGPSLVRSERRIIDPIERGDRDRKIWNQLEAKMNSKFDSRTRR